MFCDPQDIEEKEVSPTVDWSACEIVKSEVPLVVKSTFQFVPWVGCE